MGAHAEFDRTITLKRMALYWQERARQASAFSRVCYSDGILNLAKLDQQEAAMCYANASSFLDYLHQAQAGQ